jgi:hypothetical protein
MPKRHQPASKAKARAPRAKAAKKTKAAAARRGEKVPKAHAGDAAAVVFKEENSDGVTAKELLRRTAARAAVSPAFIAALVRDFKRHGAAAIAKTRELAPATYVRLSAVLLPMEAPPADEAPPEPAATPAGPTPQVVEAVARRIAELRAIIAEARQEAAQLGPGARAPGEGPDEDGPQPGEGAA